MKLIALSLALLITGWFVASADAGLRRGCGQRERVFERHRFVLRHRGATTVAACATCQPQTTPKKK